MLEDIGYSLAYAGVGVAMLGIGFVVLDLLTPGKLARHIWEDRSLSAGIVLSAGFLGLGGIIFTTIWRHSGAGLGEELQWTVTFGLLGIAIQAVAYLLLDLATPGRLGDAVCEERLHPAALVTGAMQLAVSFIVIASIA